MKIAFIAMSGIRACDTELLQLGLTLPGFVERSKAIASLPSLGLLTLAGMTPKRHAASATSKSRTSGNSTRCPTASTSSPSRASPPRSRRATNWRSAIARAACRS